MTGRHQRVRLRSSHPGLYRSIMTLSLMSVALAANFWTSNPTFNPLPKTLVGLIFCLLGVSLFLFLNVIRSLRAVRITLAISLSFMLFWGLTNAQQSLAGNASFQLPILYVALAVLQIPLLIESPVNPMTERKEK